MNTQSLLWLVALVTMLGPFSIDTYLPAFPDIESVLNVDREAISHTLGLYLLAFGFGALLWGPLSDRWGRRPIILLGLSIYIMASLLAAKAQDIHLLWGARWFQGLGASACFVAARAMVRDVLPPEQAHRLMARVMLLFASAPAIAPIIGGWLDTWWGWRSVFFFLALYGTFVWVLQLFTSETLTPERRHDAPWRKVFFSYGQALRVGAFLQYVLLAALSFEGLFLFIAGAPNLLSDQLHLTPTEYIWQFGPTVLGLMAGAQLSSYLAGHLTRSSTVGIGLILMTISVLLGGFLYQLSGLTLWVIVTPLIIYAAGLAVMMPAVSILVLDSLPHQRGLASSLQSFVQMSGNAMVASLLVPMLHGHSLSSYLMWQGLFAVTAFLLWWHSHHQSY